MLALDETKVPPGPRGDGMAVQAGPVSPESGPEPNLDEDSSLADLGFEVVAEVDAESYPRVLSFDPEVYEAVHLVEIYEEDDGKVSASCRDWAYGGSEGSSREEALERLCKVNLPGSILGRTLRGMPYPEPPFLSSRGADAQDTVYVRVMIR